jgi:uncharacterized protein
MRYLTLLFGLLLGLHLATPVAAKPTTVVAKPALWKISDSDTTIWLFGTIHMLDRDYGWRSGPVADAFNGSDTLILEALALPPAELSAISLRHSLLDGPAPLSARLPAPLAKRLGEASSALGLSPAIVERFQPWFVAVMLELQRYQQLGLKAEQGVDSQLQDLAREHGKQLLGLESHDAQLAMFSSLSFVTQTKLLEQALDEGDQAEQLVRNLTTSWAMGDLTALERLLEPMIRAEPELQATLLTNRNRAWAKQLQARLAQPGQLFVAVGAGHLLGKDSVQAFLQQQNISAMRVQ